MFLEKLSFHTRVWAGISVFYFLGVFSLVTTGVIGSTRLYFLCFSAFAAIFSGIKGGFITLSINTLTLIMFGYIYFTGLISPDHIQGIPSPDEWVVITGTFFFLCGALVLSLAVLIKAIEVSGKEFKHLLKNTSDIIWTLDKNFYVTFVNSAVYPVLGFMQKELIKKPFTQFLQPGKIDEFKNLMRNKDNVRYETIINHKNGTPIHVEITGLKINNFPESQNAYQGMIRDISQKKTREEKLQKLKKKLAQAEKFKSMGILAGSVAHDLNNILSGIATYPEVLMMDQDLDPDIKKGLNMIKDSGRKASAVVSDLLTISRGASVEMEALNINSIIDRYAAAPEFQKIRQTHQQVKIEIITEPELLNIKGSYIHIEKTIMNLVLNAAEEVSDKDNGKVLITTSNNYIDPSVPVYKDMVPGEYVILSVADNGSGIDKKNLKKIFEPFFTKKEMGKSGTGLGLTVVWNAVQDHNGFINVTSNNKGTKFDLLFPAIRQEITQKAKQGTLDEIKGQGQMILVVDDLKDQQRIAVSILENLGYRTKAVNNGYAAVEFIKNNPADLVILDMIMAPSISGLETYQMIKKINPGQKAIIASGYSESKDVLTVQDLGAGTYIKKPYTVLDMGIAVKEELEK
ncbi:MAG: response regulator [Deltaproteobacteria bacterium]|nr:response regulator [Deltaproteobacteria bacterium]